MRLGHGTSAIHFQDILREGIKPRGTNQTNWPDCPSSEDLVYLSPCYAFYFAEAAAKDNDLLILDVEVEPENLYPDEDFLAQAKSGFEDELPNLRERTSFMKSFARTLPEHHIKTLAKQSLEGLGTVGHKGVITPSQIKRVAIVPKEEVSKIIMREFDPVICLTNYKYLGEKHTAFQNSLFDRFPCEKMEFAA